MKASRFKFRAWDENYGKTVGHGDYGKMMSPDTFIGNYDDLYLKDIEEILSNPDYVFMQSTGLLDSKRVEIFEGDLFLCTSNGGDGIGVVEWDDNRAAFILRCFNEKCVLTPLLCNMVNGLETVIGNIYENPELLEAK